jgi:hypothetical protein
MKDSLFFPDGFVANWMRDVNMETLRVQGLKSHDVTSQNVGQLRGRLKGLLCIASEITGFFALLFLKPRSDRISLRGGMVNSRSAKDLDMISFDS